MRGGLPSVLSSGSIMSDHRIEIRACDCHVYLASPVDYEQCVAWIEHKTHGLLFIVSDENLDWNCIVEFGEGDISPGAWKMPLDDLMTILNQAKARLRPVDRDDRSQDRSP